MIAVKRFGLKIFHLGVDKSIPDTAVWVGRPSVFTNPYSHVKGKSLHDVKTAADSVKEYRGYSDRNKGIAKDAKYKAKGKDLGCDCGAKVEADCFAVVVMELANAVEEFEVPKQVVKKEPKPKKVKHVPTYKEF